MTGKNAALIGMALSLIGGSAGPIAERAQSISIRPGQTQPSFAAQPSRLPAMQFSAVASVNDFRVSGAGGKLIVSVDVGNSFEYREFMLKSPSRLVVDILNAVIKAGSRNVAINSGALNRVVLAQHRIEPLKIVRLVFDLGAEYRAHEVVRAGRSLQVVFPAKRKTTVDFAAPTWYVSNSTEAFEEAAIPDHWKITEGHEAAAAPVMIAAPAQASPWPAREAINALPQTFNLNKPAAAPGPAPPHAPRVMALTAGRGELLQFSDSVSRVSVSDPVIADAVVISPYDVVLNGKSQGITTIMIWHGDNVSLYEADVAPDLSILQRQLRTAFPNEKIEVSSSKDAILLTGTVSQAEVAKQSAAIAAVHAKSVVNLLQAPAAESRQVMLQVKFATVDRVSLSQLGANLFSVNNKLVGTSTTQQFQFPRIGQLQFTPGADGRPALGNQSVSVTDLLNLFAFRPDLNVGAILRLLQSKNVLEILAEPNLITVSGREASFLAGGKFPFPMLSSSGGGAQTAPVVTIQFKDFGVRLSFTPTVEPNGLIHLKVRPEVSSLDFANALTIQGFLIPAISTREVETEVDLHEGETFAIAGLMDNRVTQVVSKLPGIGDLPILGHLFRSRDLKKSQSELLVLITPSFVKPFAAGEAPPLPPFPEGFLEPSRPGQKPAEPKPVKPQRNESPGKMP